MYWGLKVLIVDPRFDGAHRPLSLEHKPGRQSLKLKVYRRTKRSFAGRIGIDCRLHTAHDRQAPATAAENSKSAPRTQSPWRLESLKRNHPLSWYDYDARLAFH